MPEETLFTFSQTMSRNDVATYLRAVADKLDDDGSIDFTAGDQSTSVSIPERLGFEVTVERDVQNPDEMELELELEWREGDGDGSLTLE